MAKKEFKYVFGPVYSWRLGVSVGIDPISNKDKICNFDCVYCQLGPTKIKTNERKVFVPTEEIIAEVNSFPVKEFDYYTISSRGEPTLALNLGGIIAGIKKAKKGKIAVITNSSLMNREDVRKDLSHADFVLAKLDADGEKAFEKINRPDKSISFNDTVEGIKLFRNEFRGRLALQVMFINNNRKIADYIALIAKEIRPDQLQVNTPLRPSGCKPLNMNDLRQISQRFKGFPVVSVYDKTHKDIKPVSDGKTALRHGNIRKLRRKK
ncbi:MAG: radical SAM protein [Candidatus Omnitrophica bacterium]|nr:radical SAM protein [Candidatus Omnitrophota bacterium]